MARRRAGCSEDCSVTPAHLQVSKQAEHEGQDEECTKAPDLTNSIVGAGANGSEAVLKTVEQEVLHPEVVRRALRRVLDELSSPTDTVVPRRTALQAELAVLEQELARLAAAVAQGGDLKTLLDGIQAREQRRRALQTEVAGLEGLVGRITFSQREDGVYEFSGQASSGQILAGVVCTKAGVAPNGPRAGSPASRRKVNWVDSLNPIP